jgi:hypothetical protein
VGNINWNPRQLGNPDYNATQKMRETAVHEMIRA